MLNNFHSIISKQGYLHYFVYQVLKKLEEKRKEKEKKPANKN